MDRFEELVDSLSTEDAATRVVSKRKVILEALNDYISEGVGKCASFLWLVDWNENNDQAACTLWSQASSNWPGYPPDESFLSVVTQTQLRPDSSEFSQIIKELERTGAKLLRFDGPADTTSDDIVQTTIKLCQRGENDQLERLVGFVQIFASSDVSKKLIGTNKRIIAKLLSNRIVFGRRQRVHDAIHFLQNSIQDGMTEFEILEKAVETLRKYITANEFCFYTHLAADGPRREYAIGKTSSEHPKLTPAVFGYLREKGDWPNRPNVQRIHDCLSNSISNPLATYIPQDSKGFEDQPVDLMLISVPIEANAEAPFVTIKLAVRPDENFLGGRFSETDEIIAKTLADYLRHLLPGIITQRRAKLIAEKLDSIDTPELLSESDDFISFWPFASLITEVLPAIESAWAVRQHTDKATKKNITNWVDQDKMPSSDRYSVPEDDSARIVTSDRGGALHWEPVLSAAEEKYWLCWKTDRNVLSEHDQIAIKLISSEMRLRAIGKLDVHELLQQTNELRHAIRSSMTGVTGHVEAISSCYESAKSMTPAERDRFLYDQALFRKSIERLQYSAEKSRMFFTDVRLLKSRLTVDDLRLYPHNPHSIVKDIVGFMRPEANRRGITVNIENKISPNLPLPVFDQDFLHIAISNLIDNAIKYARRGTNVTCVLGVSGDLWFFSVEDTGRFIPTDAREEIFTGKRQQTFVGETGQPGTGLGLPAVRRIIRVHDPIFGREEVSSTKLDDHNPSAPTALTRFTILMRRQLKKSDLDVNAT